MHARTEVHEPNHIIVLAISCATNIGLSLAFCEICDRLTEFWRIQRPARTCRARARGRGCRMGWLLHLGPYPGGTIGTCGRSMGRAGRDGACHQTNPYRPSSYPV